MVEKWGSESTVDAMLSTDGRRDQIGCVLALESTLSAEGRRDQMRSEFVAEALLSTEGRRDQMPTLLSDDGRRDQGSPESDLKKSLPSEDLWEFGALKFSAPSEDLCELITFLASSMLAGSRATTDDERRLVSNCAAFFPAMIAFLV